MRPEVQVVGPTFVLVLGLSGTHPHRSHRRDAVSTSCELACLVPDDGSGKCSRAMGLSELADFSICSGSSTRVKGMAGGDGAGVGAGKVRDRG